MGYLRITPVVPLDDKILVGGLLFLKEKITIQDSILEAWRDAGEKFLRCTKPENFPRPCEHEGGKQARYCSQASGKTGPFIVPGDDLQEHHNREKAAQLLGFLTECFEENEFDGDNLERWKVKGKRMLNY